jgi:hypothetical protein
MFGRKRILRYSLASLLGLITLVAAMLGYTKWTVERAEKRVAQLKSEGVYASFRTRSANWLEFVATGRKDIRFAGQMILSVRILYDGYLVGDRLPFSEDHLSKDEMLLKVKELVDAINALGVTRFYIRVFGNDRDEKLEHELKRLSGAPVEWLPPAPTEHSEFY